mgnify:FL=1
MERKSKSILLVFFLLACLHIQAEGTKQSDLSWVKTVGARKAPKGEKIFYVHDYGAMGDGETLNTKPIQAAIDACFAQGGGIVTFAQGVYLTGSIFVKEGVNLNIPKGVTLLGSEDIKDYPDIDTRVAGLEMVWPAALINVERQKNVMISGDGIVNGQGKVFWEKYWTMRKDYESRGLRWIVDYDCKRPRTLVVSNSEDVTIKDITFQQSGFWTIQVLYSSYCTVDGVVVQNNIGGHGPSTDGVDIDSSSRILVQNCDIDCNDDNFCLKSGRDADGLRVNRPTEYVVIRDCLSRAGGGLLTLGSETSGGIRYVLAENLKATGTKVGFRLKSAMTRGGTIEHIYVRNIEMNDVGIAFEASLNWHPAYSYSTLPKEYEGKEVPIHWTKMLEKPDSKKGIPFFKDVNLSDLIVNNSRTLMQVEGAKESLIENFTLTNIEADVENAGSIKFAKDWTLDNVLIKAKNNSTIKIEKSMNINIYNPNVVAEAKFDYSFTAYSPNSSISVAKHPEFSLLVPQLAGNLKFGIINGRNSEWLSQTDVDILSIDEHKVSYLIKDPLLRKGSLVIEATSLSNTNGLIVRAIAHDIPESLQLFWCYGGAYGQVVEKDEESLKPEYCRDDVYSLEGSHFTLYYGKTMNFSTISGVIPVSSDTRLSDAYKQQSPLQLFNSGKKTIAPVLSGAVPLIVGQAEYFAIYKQNKVADYNHHLLPDLFNQEWKK